MKKVKLLLSLFILGTLYTGCVREDTGPGCPDASCCKAEWDSEKYEFRGKITDRFASVPKGGGGFTFEEKVNNRTYWVGICSRDFELVSDTIPATHPRDHHPPENYPYLITGEIYENVSSLSASGLPFYHIKLQRVKTVEGGVIFERP